MCSHRRLTAILPLAFLVSDQVWLLHLMSVVAAPEILFVVAGSVDYTGGGGSTFWQRLVWCFRWHTLHQFRVLHLDTEWWLRQLKHALASRTMEYLFPLSVTTLQSFGLCLPLQKRHVRLVGHWSVGGGRTGVVVRNAAVVELLLSS